MTAIAGFFAPWLVYALVIALQLVVPARRVDGYVRDAAGNRLHYRLNGLRVFAVILALYVGACHTGWLARDFLWTYRFEGLAGACTLGLLFTAAIVVGAPSTGKNLAAELFFGRRENPQRGWLDAKMSLYLIGAVMLALNVISFASHQALAFPDAPSWGMFVYAGMFLFFVGEYLFFEEVHLYTYDFFAERVGFKLGWGCITFYPYFYCIGLWSEADRPAPETPIALPIIAIVVFVCGWMLARGANLQKFFFKTRPERGFVFAVETVRDDHHALLCSGFWGVSRHINYLGEIAMAVGLTLALGRPLDPIPWLYPLYYLGLLLPRQAADDRRCAAKYGALWTEYCRRVPSRIIPKIY